MKPAYKDVKNYTLVPVFDANFENNGSILQGNEFVYDRMIDAFNQAGNQGIDAEGNPYEWSATGKRWSAWYNKQDGLSYCKNGYLFQQCRATQKKDLTRENWVLDGVTRPYRDWTLEAPWLASWRRKKVNNRWTTDPDGPNILFRPGMLISVRVSFEKMIAPGCRASVWLMPATTLDGKYAGDNGYNADAGDGVEIDIFEYDPAQPTRLQCKVLAGDVLGNTPGGDVHVGPDTDLTKGFHTIELLWLDDRLVWALNGKKILEDRDRVPRLNHYLIISREMNSGVMDRSEDGKYMQANGPKVPFDAGLYPPASAIDSRDVLDKDMVIYDFIRAYEVTAKDGGSDKYDPPKRKCCCCGQAIR